MATGFSVFVNIGGKVLPSVAGAVNQTKAQLRGLEAVTAAIGSRISAPFIVAQRHINAVSKSFEKMQHKGRNLTLGVTAPVGFGAVSMVRSALERDKAGNTLEAIGGASHAERLDIEKYADKIAAKYGRATTSIRTFNEMLRAGFSVPAAKGSLESILEGSIIGETPAANAAAAVAKIATQYNLGMKTVEEASTNSRRIVDNLAFGANASPLSFDDMIQGYKFVGSAASAAGESIESTNALIVAMGKAGQTGSESGVALRSAYVRLLKPTKEGRATMARLGLDYGNYVAGGKRTGAGVASGLGAFGYDVPAKDIDRAINANKGSNEKQRKAIYDTVVSRLGADQAMDRDKIMEAVDGALTLSGSKVDLTKLMGDLKKAGASQGDLSRLFEGRQSVRMLSLLKADLEVLLKEVNEGVPGYGKKAFDKKNQGLEKAVREIDASWQTLSNTLVKTVLPEITIVFSSITEWLKNLAASSPATLKLGIGLTAAAAAAGPLLFVLGAVGRVGALALTGLLAPIGLLASGIVTLGAALAGFAAAGIARLGLMVLGFRMLAALGAGATLSAMGASLGRLALAVLLFPVTALRAIGLAMWGLVANPVGVIITGLVVALVGLGVWVSNNWAGIKSFFSGFGSSFMAGLGPAGGALGTMVGHLSSAYNWLSQLLGPLDETGTKWRSWGEAVGGAAATGVNAIVSAIQSLIGFFESAYNGAVRLGGAVKNMLGFGGGAVRASPAVPAVPLSGARALGGPVSFGKPYLVGERGPELFVPGMSGRVETNNTLRRLTADGAAAVAGSMSTSSTRTYSLNPTINITGGDDPRAIAGQVRSEMERYLRDLEAEQRGLLSD